MAVATDNEKVKDPDAVKDYEFDWSEFLDGDTLLTNPNGHEILVEPSGGVTIDSSSNDDTTVTVFVSGGTVGTDVKVVCRVFTAGGRTDDACLELEIRNC